MLQGIGNAVGRKFPFDGISWAARAVALGTAALDHKARNDAVKRKAVIKAFFHQIFKILYRFRSGGFIQLDFYFAPIFHFHNNHISVLAFLLILL